MSRTIASNQINPFSGPRFSIDWKKKFASVLVRGRNLGGFEYDRFPINKDSRDNGARSSTWKAERGRRGGGGTKGVGFLSVKDNETALGGGSWVGLR